MFVPKTKKLSGKFKGEGTLYGEGVFDVSMNEKNMSLIMSALSNLYSNPEGAVARELISNAIDASENGEDIEITISGDTFIVRDHGCGMNAEELKENYVNYGNSSKAYDFSKVGAYGFGSKSPLAVTDSYEVISSDGKETNRAVVKVTQNGLKGRITSCEPMSRGTKVVVKGIENIRGVKNMVESIAYRARKNRYIINGEVVSQKCTFEKKMTVDGNEVLATLSFDNEGLASKWIEFVKSGYSHHEDKIAAFVSVNDIVYPMTKIGAGFGSSYYGAEVKFDVEPGVIQFSPSREIIPSRHDEFLKNIWESWKEFSHSSELVHLMKDVIESDRKYELLYHSREIMALSEETSIFCSRSWYDIDSFDIFKKDDCRYVFVNAGTTPSGSVRVPSSVRNCSGIKDKKVFGSELTVFVLCKDEETFNSFKKLDRDHIFSMVDGKSVESIFTDYDGVKKLMKEALGQPEKKRKVAPYKVLVYINGDGSFSHYDRSEKKFGTDIPECEHRFYAVRGEIVPSKRWKEDTVFVLFEGVKKIAFKQMEEMGFKRVTADCFANPETEGDFELKKINDMSSPYSTKGLDVCIDTEIYRSDDLICRAAYMLMLKEKAPERFVKCCDLSLLDQFDEEVVKNYDLYGVLNKTVNVDEKKLFSNFTSREIKNICAVNILNEALNRCRYDGGKILIEDAIEHFGIDRSYVDLKIHNSIGSYGPTRNAVYSLFSRFEKYMFLASGDQTFLDLGDSIEMFKKAELGLFKKIETL